MIVNLGMCASLVHMHLEVWRKPPHSLRHHVVLVEEVLLQDIVVVEPDFIVALHVKEM